MKGGLIAYANQVKVSRLGVLSDDLNRHGAVSKPVAMQMARGVARRLDTNIGVSTTGIAGPGGGTEEKPVGTVWIGFWSEDKHFALKAHFTNDRLINKERSAAVALEVIRRSILGIEEMPYGLKKYPT
jgi:nicotinamide-nucleotide amidase